MKGVPDNSNIQMIFDRQLRRGFLGLTVISIFALAISIMRVFTVGWQPVMALHICLCLILAVSVILDRYLSFHALAAILIGVIFIKGVGGLISWGLTGMGLPPLVICCILCTIGFGVRAGIFCGIASLICFSLIGMAFHLNYFSLPFDPAIYLNSLSAWATGIITITMSAGLMVIALGTINKQLLSLIKKLDQRNWELLGINKKLEEEIKEREKLSSEKIELQAKLQRSQKMELVANIAGGVAHDLNNVLSGAISYPDLVCMELTPDSPLRDSLEKIKKSGLRAAAIVSDLLALVRRGIITKNTTNINLLISEYLNSPEFNKLVSYHPGVKIETVLDETLWNMEGSPIHLIKAIMNLVSNGVEAISGPGKLAITTRNLTLEASIMAYDDEMPPGEYVALEVTDTGSGMSQEEMEMVFEPFYSKKVMGKSGTGLGMTVVWGAVKDHQGHIKIQSEKEKGTSFTIYFPASRQEMADMDTDLPFDSYKGNGEKILIIDDMPDQREVAVALLMALGYKAIALPNGEAAIQYLQKNRVDLVMLDMIMHPGMDGLDTYKEIVKLNPSQKALIATGYCETERVKEAQKLGSGHCLEKPFTLEKLGKTVKSELRFKKAS